MTHLGEARRHQLISRLAYECWERRGRPLGTPEIDWLTAERAIDADRSALDRDLPFSAIRMEPDEGPWR